MVEFLSADTSRSTMRSASALRPAEAALVCAARQQGYRINLMLVGQSLLITAVSLVLAWSGWGITGQAWRCLGKLGFLSGPDVHRVAREPGLTSGGLDRAR